MEENEKIKIIDAFLKALDAVTVICTVPGLLDDHPDVSLNKTKERKYRIIEEEMERFKLVHFIEGKDNSTIDSFAYYRLAPKGLELLINDMSCKVLYDAENRQKEKEELELNLKRKQTKTFWWLFVLSIIGGMLGIISFIMQVMSKG
jgi:hypothetical protein